MGFRIGVDIGGTFTDFCVLDESSGEVRTLKVLSTPDKPGAEVIEGLSLIEQRFGIPPQAVTYFTHGTTVGVNTVIQRRGAKLALFVTGGFEDVLEVARLKMPDPYDLFSRRAAPLAPRERVYGLAERTLADGSILRPVDDASVLAAVAAAQAESAETIVVALLHAYANPSNERRVAAVIAKAAPGLGVTLSSAVWPIIREYERTVTATVAGYVQVRVANYLSSLQSALKSAGVAPEPMITKSNGGVMRAELGKIQPIQMLLSGTASGVIGAARVAAEAGAANVLSLDVGGTSADVAVIVDGKPRFGTGEMVGEFPIYIPTVAVTSIGAGGGSIAEVDEQGVLKVGPESAGSTPGPACYGRGGTRATITDAYAVCGLLGSGELGYGAVRLDLERAKRAVGDIATQLSLSSAAAAEAIIKVSISGMFLEISKLLSRQGADPRTFTLIPFGGAGPMTACLVADDLGIDRIVVPPTPGVLAAYGGLIADVRNDFVQTVLTEVDAKGADTIAEAAARLEAQATAWLRDEHGHTGEARLLVSADMRYRGQSYEIEVPLDSAWITARDLARITGAFHREHARIYEYADEKAPVQMVNVRVVALGTSPQPARRIVTATPHAAQAAASTDVYLAGSWRQAGVFDRATLKPGAHFAGPAIVRQGDCTTCIVAGFGAVIDTFGNLVIERSA
ncbi:MAG: hydantoinase/oxoprolinase family protein [Hyphomicrobiaceae bacterium]